MENNQAPQNMTPDQINIGDLTKTAVSTSPLDPRQLAERTQNIENDIRCREANTTSMERVAQIIGAYNSNPNLGTLKSAINASVDHIGQYMANFKSLKTTEYRTRELADEQGFVSRMMESIEARRPDRESQIKFEKRIRDKSFSILDLLIYEEELKTEFQQSPNEDTAKIIYSLMITISNRCKHDIPIATIKYIGSDGKQKEIDIMNIAFSEPETQSEDVLGEPEVPKKIDRLKEAKAFLDDIEKRPSYNFHKEDADLLQIWEEFHQILTSHPNMDVSILDYMPRTRYIIGTEQLSPHLNLHTKNLSSAAGYNMGKLDKAPKIPLGVRHPSRDTLDLVNNPYLTVDQENRLIDAREFIRNGINELRRVSAEVADFKSVEELRAYVNDLEQKKIASFAINDILDLKLVLIQNLLTLSQTNDLQYGKELAAFYANSQHEYRQFSDYLSFIQAHTEISTAQDTLILAEMFSSLSEKEMLITSKLENKPVVEPNKAQFEAKASVGIENRSGIEINLGNFPPIVLSIAHPSKRLDILTNMIIPIVKVWYETAAIYPPEIRNWAIDQLCQSSEEFREYWKSYISSTMDSSKSNATTTSQ